MPARRARSAARPRPHGSTPNPGTGAPQAGHRPPSAPSRMWPHSRHVRCCRARRVMAASASAVSSVASASGAAWAGGGRRRRVSRSMRTGTAGRIASRPSRPRPGTGRRLRRVQRPAQRAAVARVRCRVPHPSFTVSPGRPADGVQVHASTPRRFCRASPSAIRRNQRSRAVIAPSRAASSSRIPHSGPRRPAPGTRPRRQAWSGGSGDCAPDAPIERVEERLRPHAFRPRTRAGASGDQSCPVRCL